MILAIVSVSTFKTDIILYIVGMMHVFNIDRQFIHIPFVFIEGYCQYQQTDSDTTENCQYQRTDSDTTENCQYQRTDSDTTENCQYQRTDSDTTENCRSV